jgi:SAM-dependent methyltransferase
MMPASTVFDAYSRYYDLLYRDKDYAAEVDYIDRLLKRHGIDVRELLEFGSGTGKHGRLLAERGYRVTGIERSAEMVAQVVPVDGFACRIGDIATVQLGRTFDAVLSLFHVISYQTTNDAIRAVFARAAEHLQPGGLFVFDVWYSPAVYAQRPVVRVKQLEDAGLRITRIAEPQIHCNENRIDVHYRIFVQDIATGTMQTLTEIHSMRHFSLPELDLLAENAGFERLTAEGFLTGKPASEETWGLCLVLKKV